MKKQATNTILLISLTEAKYDNYNFSYAKEHIIKNIEPISLYLFKSLHKDKKSNKKKSLKTIFIKLIFLFQCMAVYLTVILMM